MDFILSLFNTSEFIARGNMGGWSPLLQWTYWSASVLIFSCYMALPVVLIFMRVNWSLVAQSEQLRFLFSLFIFFNGVGHMEKIITFYYPAYRMITLWHVCTAILSWAALFGLFVYRKKDVR